MAAAKGLGAHQSGAEAFEGHKVEDGLGIGMPTSINLDAEVKITGLIYLQ